MDEETIEKIKQYYIEENHTKKETCAFLELSPYQLDKAIKNYNIKKSKEKINEKIKKSHLQRTPEEQEKINEKRKKLLGKNMVLITIGRVK